MGTARSSSLILATRSGLAMMSLSSGEISDDSAVLVLKAPRSSARFREACPEARIGAVASVSALARPSPFSAMDATSVVCRTWPVRSTRGAAQARAQQRRASHTALAGGGSNRHQHLVPANALDAYAGALPPPGKVMKLGPRRRPGDGPMPRR